MNPAELSPEEFLSIAPRAQRMSKLRAFLQEMPINIPTLCVASNFSPRTLKEWSAAVHSYASYYPQFQFNCRTINGERWILKTIRE